MKLLIVGDFKGNTGPASVNKGLKKVADNDTIFLEDNSILKRIIKLLIYTKKVDAVLFSGLSKINIIGFKIAKFYNKKSAYLMHGSKQYENKVNGIKSNNGEVIEYKVLEYAPKIIAVSKLFMNRLIESYPEYESKITYVNNGIDWNIKEEINIENNKNIILSVGGGVPQKNIKYVCKAIQNIRRDTGRDIKFIVIGKSDFDTDEIKSYSFVEYLENISKDEMYKFYKKSSLYIQNSTFETFGLASIEALLHGCSLLISQYVGAKELLEPLAENDIIDNPYSIQEIERKLIYLLENSNNSRILKNIDRDNTDLKSSYNKIKEIIKHD